MQKTALIIATPAGVGTSPNGATLRVKTVSGLLCAADFEVVIVSHDEARQMLAKEWDVIALVSFATARWARLARHSTKFLWLDCTDSWTLSRLSVFRAGKALEGLKWLLDVFFLSIVPTIDLVTFISRRDHQCQKRWSRRRNVLIFPNFLSLDGENRKPAAARRLVFVGPHSYFPNRQSLRFLEKVARHLPPHLRIQVFGVGYENARLRRLYYCGSPSHEDLYQELDVHLVPSLSGAGIKNKAAYPLALGLAVVATEEGASGLAPNPNLFLSSPEPAAFACAIMKAIHAPATGLTSERLFLEDETEIIKRLLSTLSSSKAGR